MTEDANTVKDGTNFEMEPKEEANSVKFPIRLTMDKRIELVIAGAIVLFGIFLIAGAVKFQKGVVPDPITSKGMPYLIGSFCIACGIALGALRLKSWSVLPGNMVPGEGHEDEERHPSSWVRVFSIVLTTWLSVVLLNSVGYLIVTPIFMIISIWLMGTRSWGKLVIFPIVYTLLTWYLFSQPLQFVLPLGFLAPFFRSHGLTP